MRRIDYNYSDGENLQAWIITVYEDYSVIAWVQGFKDIQTVVIPNRILDKIMKKGVYEKGKADQKKEDIDKFLKDLEEVQRNILDEYTDGLTIGEVQEKWEAKKNE